MLRASDLPHIVCPRCRGALAFSGDTGVDQALARGVLRCSNCGAAWPVDDGLARLYRETEVRGTDRLLRHFYDNVPSLHDPAVRFLLPLAGAGREDEIRAGYLGRLELETLAAPAGRAARILDVGIGTGADLPAIRRLLPPGVPVELWGVDLSRGMIERCRRRLARAGDTATRLLLADAHALPFPDGSFDRVFHVGATNSFRDPRRALAELARVAAPGAPIILVDEQLDPARRHGAFHRAMFRLLTFYNADARAPREHLPPGAVDVVEEQLGRFFFCLRFRRAP